MRTCNDNLWEPKTELDYIFKILSLKQKILIISLLEEEKDLLFPFIDQNLWAEERVAIINTILVALSGD